MRTVPKSQQRQAQAPRRGGGGGGGGAGPKKKKIEAPSFTGNAHLDRSPINLISLREHARNQLKKLLQNVAGRTKHLVWDTQLLGRLNYIISVAFPLPPLLSSPRRVTKQKQTKLLQEQGVTSRSPLARGKFQSQCDSIVYLSFPDAKNMKIIAHQILQHSEFRPLFLFLP